MTVAGLLALALSELLGMARGYWAVLTAVIVTQANVGGSIKASIDRLIGTLCGALYGGAIALLNPHPGPIVGFAVVAGALAPLALLSALSASFRIAPVTAIILLLSPAGSQAGVSESGVLASAIQRVVEIGFGCVVGLVCSLIVLPARAGRLVAEAAAAITDLFAELTPLQLTGPGAAGVEARVQALQDRIRAALGRLEALVEDARHERRAYLADPVDPSVLPRTLLRLRHDLVMLRRAMAAPLASDAIVARLRPRLDGVAANCADFLGGVSETLRGRAAAPSTAAAHRALDAYAAEIDILRRDGLTRTLPNEAVERLFTLGFALDQLGRDLDDLAARAEERAAS